MSGDFGAGADAWRDELRVDVVTAALQSALTGPRNVGASAVVWSDRGSQIVLHVGKLQLRALENTLVVAVDTQSAEFGVAPLIVRFVFGGREDPASLVAATDEGALGHPAVAARWGTLFRDVVWAALVRLLVSHADSHGLAPASVEIGPERFLFAAEPEVSVRELAEQHHRGRRTEVPEGEAG
ncbi:hypothetical protein [Kribbella sp. NPDC051718]|uniref:hypothetical protein n=1 Tax=Kribbella sp. NPDC051718 TaxID=3155168 RepID=UPI00343208F3